MVLYHAGDAPLLLTDPWLVGSVYWRSWWLQNYPTPEELDWLGKSAIVYVTHEHPDHFHMPSIRRLGAAPEYLFPALTERGFLAHMARNGFRADVLPPLTWRALADDVSILSIPMWNDDSLLLVDTRSALIINLNDAKPLPPVLKAIQRFVCARAKPTLLLCSYSPASLINSFSDADGMIRLKEPRQYVDYASRLCDLLGANFYLPFASQAVFNREDSVWANDYRTSWEDLERYWTARARLLPPYVTLDLGDFSCEHLPPSRYRAADPAAITARTRARMKAENETIIEDSDVAGLAKKLNAFRWLWMPIFPRGFAFALGERILNYNPFRGILAKAAEPAGDFVVAVPKLTAKEAIRNNHLSDLGITMFVRVRLLRRIDPRKVYALFVMFAFDDYRHLAGPRAFLRWLWSGIRFTFGLRLPVPTNEEKRDRRKWKHLSSFPHPSIRAQERKSRESDVRLPLDPRLRGGDE